MMGCVLIISTFLYINNLYALPTLVKEDTFVFRVLNEVISLNDMQRDYGVLQDLKCYYPESILVVIFEDLKKSADNIKFSKLTGKEIVYSVPQRDFFSKVIKFYKLKAYTSGQQVVVNPGIVGGFYTVAKRSGCRLSGFESSDKFETNFEKILKMEIFLRARFMPDEKGPPDLQRLDKIKSSATLFLESVSKQITEEVFW